MSGRPSILVVRSQKPSSGVAAGGELRARSLEQALAAVGVVSHFYAESADDNFDEAASRGAMWGVIKQKGLIPRNTPRELARLAESADVIFLQDFAAFWRTGLADRDRAIIDVGDLWSQMWGQGLRRGSALKRVVKALRYRWVRWSEQALLDGFRCALVCSDDDRRYLGHPRLRVVPNCVQESVLNNQQQLERHRDLLFVGTLFYPPNLEGLRWFAQEVFPIIRSRNPSATLTVVGFSPAPLPESWQWLVAPGIEMLGTVPDVAPYVRSAKLEICPILLGGGTRIKVIESIASGTPVVATTIGAYGLLMSEGEGLYRRDTADGFATACLDLLNDPGKRDDTRSAGQSHVRARYSQAAVDEEIAKIVKPAP